VSLGVITVAVAPRELRTSWLYAASMPAVAAALFALLAIVFSLEAWICVVMALPLLVVFALVGGLLTCLLFTVGERIGKNGTTTIVLLVVASPYLLTPLEGKIPPQDSIRRVTTAIEIEAPPEAVWRNIIRFAPVQPGERHFSWYHLAGLPRPTEATLSFEGVGAVRRGQWEDGLVFVGTIQRWETNRSFNLTLAADTSQVQGSSLPLAGIGGLAFAVLDDEYVIQPLGANRVRLVLTTTHRLSTHFNGYGGLWTDALMRDIQGDMLSIVKSRSEAVS
jgi:uncharacterized protein YndB with AHSA1/START domain